MQQNKPPHLKMVVYTDGSCAPNPGHIGYGIHGYTYHDEVPKKNYGGKAHLVSSQGYIDKDKTNKVKNVTPVKIFDIAGSWPHITTNNVAEILGVKNALQKAFDENVKEVYVKTDSEYVQKGYNDWLYNWHRNNWRNREGREIANAQQWQEMWDVRQALKDKGVKVKVTWVKGHAGMPGNEQADKLANIGRINSTNGKVEVIINEYQVDNYWEQKVLEEKHPLICKSWMYFKAAHSSHIPGEYYFGNVGKDEDFLGKRDANSAYAIVILKKPEEPLESIRQYQAKHAKSENSIIVLNVRALYSGDRIRDLLDYGQLSLVQINPRKNDLYFIDSYVEEQAKQAYIDQDRASEEDEENDNDQEPEKEDKEEQFSKADPITREQWPVKLAQRSFECLTLMKNKLSEYQTGDTRHTTLIDITDEFYHIETKLVRKELRKSVKLKSDFRVGHLSHDIQIDYEGKKIPIRLNLGIDIPDRNALKRLEEHDPKVTLLIWKESEQVIRYVTVIECPNALSIWAGFYSNYIFL